MTREIRLFHDWVRVKMEPPREKTRSGIILTVAEPIRIARAIALGPGRLYADGTHVPMELKVGDRFPLHVAAAQFKQGQALAFHLEDDEAIIRETDVLFVIEEGDPEITA